MRLLRASAAAALVLFTAASARAGDPALAREQLKLGYNLAQEGKCAEAIPHLAESLRLDPKAITLINLASCEERVGKWADALGHWVDARSRAQNEGARPIEEEAERRQKELEPKLPHLTIVLPKGAPSGAVVLRDGVELGAVSLGVAIPVDPGVHTLVTRAPGRADASIELNLAEGEAKTIEAKLGGERAAGAAVAPAPPADRGAPSGTSPLVWIGFGVAGAGAAVGTVTGLMALGKASSADEACPDLACRDQGALDDVSSGRTLGTVSTIAFAIAGAGAVLGVYGLVWGGRGGGARASVSLGPGAAALRGTF